MLGVAASLLITIGLLLLSLRIMRRLGQPTSGGSGGVNLQVVQRIGVGPRQGIALVRVGARVLVVSVGEQGSRLLTELEGDDRERIIATGGAESQLSNAGSGLSRIIKLGTIGLFLALSVGAAPLVAQGPDSGAANGEQTSALGSLPQFDVSIGNGESGLELSGPVGIVLFLGVMTVIPALLLMMTSFTRILIVLHLVRSALGTQSSPPGQLLVAMSLVMTMVVMGPTMNQANEAALQPYLRGEIAQLDAFQMGLEPFRNFMAANTSDNELQLFVDLNGSGPFASVAEIPTMTLMSSFVTSELRTAFQMGFVIFLPFIVIDLVVASVLMSMGMFMLPPVMVSLPFKLLLFVLADGWVLLVRGVVASFQV